MRERYEREKPVQPFYHFYSSFANDKAFKIFIAKVGRRFFFYFPEKAQKYSARTLGACSRYFLRWKIYLKIETGFHFFNGYVSRASCVAFSRLKAAKNFVYFLQPFGQDRF